MVRGGKEEGDRGGGSEPVKSDRRGDDGRTRRYRGGEDGGYQGEDAYGVFQLGESGGSCSEGVQGVAA